MKDIFKSVHENVQIKTISETEDKMVVGLYGVVFGGSDLVGDTFTKSTKFNMERIVGTPVHIEHTRPTKVEMDGKLFVTKPIKAQVGEVIEVDPDDVGLYMKVQFERVNQYWGLVKQMVDSGLMGASTGSDHRALKSANGNIEIWPINELSITLTPMDPRTLGTMTKFTKSLMDAGLLETANKPVELTVENLIIKSTNVEIQNSSNAQEVSPEAAEVADEQVETDESILEENSKEDNGENIMAEEIKNDGSQVEIKGFSSFEQILLDIKKGQEDNQKALADFNARVEAMEEKPADKSVLKTAPTVLNYGLGDSEEQAIKAWAAGDGGDRLEIKASNATDMNIGTAADGGNITRQGFYDQIIMRRDETDLTQKLPVMRLFGTENSVDIPTFDEDDGEFVTTAEAAAYDEDAPALGKKVSTLDWKTKVTKISNQLLQSAAIDGGVEQLLAQFIGMGLAKTRNEMLVTEVLANSTANTPFSSASALAFGEPESILKNNNLSPYLDSDSAIAWLMSNNTLWTLRSIVGDDRQYYQNHNDDKLLGFKVATSQKMPAIAASAKSMVLGNWNYLAYREVPSLTLIRDQYTLAANGQIRIVAHFAAAFTVTQSEAFVHGVHPAS